MQYCDAGAGRAVYPSVRNLGEILFTEIQPCRDASQVLPLS